MKKWKKPLLIVSLVLIFAVSGLCIWQWNNLKAIHSATTKDTETVGKELEQVRNDFQESFGNENQVELKLPTLDQTTGLLEGTIDPEELKEALGITKPSQPSNPETPTDPSGDTSTQQPSDTPSNPSNGSSNQQPSDTPSNPSNGSSNQQPSDNPSNPSNGSSNQQPSDNPSNPSNGSSNQQPSDNPSDDDSFNQYQPGTSNPSDEPDEPDEPAAPTAQELLDRCVMELTSCEIDLMAQLGAVRDNALAEWSALPEEERTSAKKLEFGMSILNQCSSMESSVDAQVSSILGQYRGELAAIGADTSAIDTLWDYYVAEKEAQRAYYVSQLLG